MNNLYEDDYDQWTKEQKKILQSGNLSKLDIESLIEELEEMGDQGVNKLTSFIRVLTTHLLKFNYQKNVLKDQWVEQFVLNSWKASIYGPRDDIERVLKKNPNLKTKMRECLETGYKQGKGLAIKEMNVHIKDESKKLNNKSFPDICPWSFEQIIEEDFFPEDPIGGSDE